MPAGLAMKTGRLFFGWGRRVVLVVRHGGVRDLVAVGVLLPAVVVVVSLPGVFVAGCFIGWDAACGARRNCGPPRREAAARAGSRSRRRLLRRRSVPGGCGVRDFGEPLNSLL